MIEIIQWNARSVHNQTKQEFLKSMSDGIIVLQEIWKQEAKIQDIGKILHIDKREVQRGGGTLMIYKSEHPPRVINSVENPSVKV
jgi:exonuclease III